MKNLQVNKKIEVIHFFRRLIKSRWSFTKQALSARSEVPEVPEVNGRSMVGGREFFFFLVYKKTIVSHPAIQNEVMIYFNHCIYLEIFITSIYYSFSLIFYRTSVLHFFS
jgi:hypothetical protein